MHVAFDLHLLCAVKIRNQSLILDLLMNEAGCWSGVDKEEVDPLHFRPPLHN